MNDIKSRVIKGVVALTSRGLFLRFLSFVSLGVLGAVLTESEFGVFFIVSAVVNFLTYFSDIGLAAALVQKKSSVSDSDLKTTFTIQQILVLALLFFLYLFTPHIVKTYSLSSEGVFLLFSLGFSFFMSSLKTIPSILLERDLEFSKWIIPQLLEDLIYNIFVVIFALMGLGITSFSYAILLRSVFGLVAVYVVKPWIPGLQISYASLKHLIRFGVPYQVNTLLAVVKDDGMTLVLGGVLGSSGMGILGWAQKWVQVPLRLFMDTVTKVSFPAFSRLQSSKNGIKAAVTKSIFFICLLVFPSIVAMCILAPELINIIPKYERWRPALIPLYLLSINVFLAAATTQLTNLFNAIGKIKITFRLMVMWTVLSWLLIPFLSIKYGVNGAALAYALVGLSSVVAIYLAKRAIDFSITKSMGYPALASGIMGVVMVIIKNIVIQNLTGVVITGVVGIVTYLLFIYIIARKSFSEDVKKIYHEFIKKD